MSKSSQAFRTIREVSDWLDVKAHVLRFWESKFPQIKPVKRAGGRRYYRPGDMELVGGIKVLLHEQGMTIKGVQNLIRDEGTAHVAALSPPIDMLGFEDAPSNEIEAWDRELAAEAVEDAEVITDKFAVEAGVTAPTAEPDAATPTTEAFEREPEPQPDTAAQTVAPELAPPQPIEELPADGEADQAEFDLEAELAQLEAALAIDGAADTEDAAPAVEDEAAKIPEAEDIAAAPAESDSAPEAAEDAAEMAEAEADAAPAAEDLATPEIAETPHDTTPVTEDQPAPEAAEAETVQAEPAPAAPRPEPAASETAMPALMAAFAELTARIPELPQDQRARLAPILQRSAELAARMSA